VPISTTNVITGQASIFTAPAGTALPADDLLVGVDWAVPWVNVGATEEGLQFLSGSNTQDITIEEQSLPVAVLVTSRNIRLQFSVSEDTLASMKLAYGGGVISTVAPGTTQIGKSVLTLSDVMDRLAVGFEVVNPTGFYRRVYVPTVLSVADVTTSFRRAANNRSYNVELRAVCPPNQIVITDKTANHT
jgi:predicted metal-dependent phosphotriesterase family hydrolase